MRFARPDFGEASLREQVSRRERCPARIPDPFSYQLGDAGRWTASTFVSSVLRMATLRLMANLEGDVHVVEVKGYVAPPPLKIDFKVSSANTVVVARVDDGVPLSLASAPRHKRALPVTEEAALLWQLKGSVLDLPDAPPRETTCTDAVNLRPRVTPDISPTTSPSRRSPRRSFGNSLSSPELLLSVGRAMSPRFGWDQNIVCESGEASI